MAQSSEPKSSELDNLKNFQSSEPKLVVRTLRTFFSKTSERMIKCRVILLGHMDLFGQMPKKFTYNVW